MSILTRLKKLEKPDKHNYSDIIRLIRQGAYYDEITPSQQKKYVEYKESLGGCCEELSCAELDVLLNKIPKERVYHFRLSVRRKPPTQEEYEQSVKEIDKIVSGWIKEYNSPDAVAQRQKKYEEICRIGRLRRQAFLNGEDMDKYPLP